MAKYRTTQMGYWNDPYIERLSKDGKLLYIYMITSPHTNNLGVLEVTLKKIAYETDIDVETIEGLLNQMERDGKVVRDRDIIWLVKFIKHQCSVSPQLWKSMSADALEVDSVKILKAMSARYPQLGIPSHMLSDETDTLSIPYQYPMDTLSIPSGELEQELEHKQEQEYKQDAVGNKGGTGGEEPTPAPERRDGGGEQEQMLTDYTPEEREVLSLFKGVHDLKQPDTGKLIRQIRTLKADFPAVDLLAEAKKMALWLDSREKKQNAKSNLLLFMRNWVERASKTPSPPIADLQRYKNGPPSPVPNADGSIGKVDEGNAERNKRLAEKYMKQFGDRMTGGEAP